jgi:glycosyltransferase involved in cell wall biosynthesis
MIKSGWNGYLCDPYEDQSWIATLTALATSAEARDWVGRNGRATCLDQFDIRSTAAKFEELYLELALGGERINS